MRARQLALTAFLIVCLPQASGCSATSTSIETSPTLPVLVDLSGITAEGRIEPNRFVEIAPYIDATVAEVLVMEGEQVDAGQIIARLENPQTQTLDRARTDAGVELGNAYQAVKDAQRRLDEFNVPRVFSGMTAVVATRTWLRELDAARVAFEPYKDASRKKLRPNYIFPNLPRRVWFDMVEYKGVPREYKKKLDIAWVNYRKAVQWLTLESDLESAQARLAQAQTNNDSLQDASLSEDTAGRRAALATAELRAPFAGTVTNLDMKSGEFVAAGKVVVTVADLGSWVVKTTNLTEMDVLNARLGMPVTFTVDAIPDMTFNGHVLSIGQNYTERQGDIVYAASILVTERHPAMRWGMTAHVDFGK